MAPQPLPADAHIDRYLTDMAVSWSQDQSRFIANKVFPVLPVKKQSDLYVVYEKGYFYRDEMRPRPLGGRAARTGYRTSRGSYYCEEEALSHPIDDRQRANADQPLDPDRAGMRILTTQAMIHQDRKWADAYFTTGVWGLDLRGRSATPGAREFLQFDQAASDPIGVVDEYRDDIASRTGFEPNVGVFGRATFRAIKNHPEIIDRVKYTQRGVLTAELLSELFGLDRVVVPGGVQNTAAEGQTDDIDFIVPSKGMLLVHAASAPSIDTPSGGYSFAWTDLIPGATNAFGGVIARYREEQEHSDILEIRVASDQKQVASELGVFFDAAVA